MTSDLDYRNNGVLFVEHGNTRVYKLNDEFYMESGAEGNLVSSEDDLRNYIWQLGKKPYGDVLVLGLGLGFGVNYILSLPKVKSVTVVEPSIDVIKCQQTVIPFIDSAKTVVCNKDFFRYLYEAGRNFDFVFVDCYKQIDNTTWPFIADVVAATKRVCKPSGSILGWIDENTSEYWLRAFQILF